MNAWPGESGDIMGPTVTRTGSAKPNTPPLKNGKDLRESGYLIAVGSRTARFRRKHQSKMLLIILLTLLLVLLCIAIIMTVLYIKHRRHKPIRVCESKECLRSAANLIMSMDTTADPCEDFYQYVCGNWGQDHPRPDAYRSYDWFRDKQTKVYTVVRDFLSRNSSQHPKPVQQAKDMYAACMDTETLDKLGLKPVMKVLEALGLPMFPSFINATDDFDYSTYKFDWIETVIKIKTHLAMDVLIGFDIFTDPKNSSVYRLVMGSPETTNPFPSLQKGKNLPWRNKGKRRFRSQRDETEETLVFNNQYYFENRYMKTNTNNEEDIYKIFYAELIKLFVIEAGVTDATKLTETELDQNIFLTANEYFTMNNYLYELDAVNSTSSIDYEDIFSDIPEYTVDELQNHTDAYFNNETAPPNLWKRYLEGIFNISDVRLDFETDKILVTDADYNYLMMMSMYVHNTPPVVMELYIWMKVVEVMSTHTTSEVRALFQRAKDAMHHKHSATPRSLQCASAVNDMMGMAVAYAIADPSFYSDTKPKIQTMLTEMKNALAQLVDRAQWMDDSTKLETYQKIIEMRSLIGFPDWLLDDGKLEEYYEGMDIAIDTHLDNMINIIQVKIKKALNKFRDGNNITWATDPTEVNAYHTFQENTISEFNVKVLTINEFEKFDIVGNLSLDVILNVILLECLDAAVPIVMLQYPFFDLGLDSLNYGSLGSVLGHEITHGFDNYGRKFDKNGNMLPWWSNSTVQSFVNMTQCFIDQYSEYLIPEVGEYVDGKKTLGENIADNGGMREAFEALKAHLKKRGPEPKLPGFQHMTSEQMFFLSYGNLWCGVSTQGSLKADLHDEHSPQVFRARGVLQNSEDFARAWRCSPGTGMNPGKRCIIF